MAHVSRVGRHMEQGLRALAAKHAFVKDVRGAGLIWGLELDREATAVVPQGLAHGVIVNRTAETVVRLLPPLVITEPEIDDALGKRSEGRANTEHRRPARLDDRADRL